MKVTAIILAGGKNLRLGRTKALETIGGKRLIQRVMEQLKPLTCQILIVTGNERTDLAGIVNNKFVTDLYPGCGPLGGIYSGLMTSLSSHSIVVACDMPFLNTKLLEYMIEQTGDFDAVVPRLEGMIEPLHAVYSRSCIEKIKKRLDSKQLSVQSFVSTLGVKYIEQVDCQRLDPKLLSFFNINYQVDLERAIAIETECNR